MSLPNWLLGWEEHAMERATADRMLESAEVVLNVAERRLQGGGLAPTPRVAEALKALRSSIQAAKAQDRVSLPQMAEVTVAATRVTKLVRRVA